MKKIIMLSVVILSLACKQKNTPLIYDSLIEELKDVDINRYAISLKQHAFSNERIIKTLIALRSQADFSEIIPTELNVSYTTELDLTIPESAKNYLSNNSSKTIKSNPKLEVGYGLPIKLVGNYYCYFSYYHFYEDDNVVKAGSERVTILKYLPNKKWQVIKNWQYLDI